MKYRGHDDFHHDVPGIGGVLLVNLGTPEAPDRRSVRRYLKQFLWDPRVVELPRWLWWLILNGIILNIRPGRSARAYRQVWTDEGSPLLVHTRRQVEALQKVLNSRAAGRIRVEPGMRYGEPSIAHGLQKLHKDGVRDLLVLPLYPQYSATTTGSVFDEVAHCLQSWRWVPSLRFVNSYHDDPAYIRALSGKIEAYWDAHSRGDHLIMSFHGLPKRYLLAGDPYYCHCHKTARLLAQALGLADGQWSLVFQSRFGREEWLRPYCDDELEKLAADNVRNVDMVCPGFAADCLETLEEVGMQYRELFLSAGGEQLNYIPCLNDDAEHIELLARISMQNLSDPADIEDLEGLEKRRSRATAMGARR